MELLAEALNTFSFTLILLYGMLAILVGAAGFKIHPIERDLPKVGKAILAAIVAEKLVEYLIFIFVSI